MQQLQRINSLEIAATTLANQCRCRLGVAVDNDDGKVSRFFLLYVKRAHIAYRVQGQTELQG